MNANAPTISRKPGSQPSAHGGGTGRTVFSKGACVHCGGHIEFPTYALGRAIECPHCHASTPLKANLNDRRRNYFKCSCARCSGHIEFPVELADTSVACPHCGEQTRLEIFVEPVSTTPSGWEDGLAGREPTRKSGGGFWLLALAAVVVLLLMAGGIVPFRSSPQPPVAQTPVQSPKPAGDLEVLDYRLEKAEKSGLLYLVGTLTNHSAKAFSAVRVEVDLLASAGDSLGNIFDYRERLEPHGVWELKVLVLQSNAEQARLVGVTGQRQ